MTCIVAIAEDGIIHMGADSAASNSYAIRTRKDTKIFNGGDFIFWLTS